MRAGSPKSAAIFAGISRDPSGECRQEADRLEAAQRRGWNIAQIYVDQDLSAFNPQTPGLKYQRLLSDIQFGSRDGVVIGRLDCLHRQLRRARGVSSCYSGAPLTLVSSANHVNPTHSNPVIELRATSQSLPNRMTIDLLGIRSVHAS